MSTECLLKPQDRLYRRTSFIVGWIQALLSSGRDRVRVRRGDLEDARAAEVGMPDYEDFCQYIALLSNAVVELGRSAEPPAGEIAIFSRPVIGPPKQP